MYLAEDILVKVDRATMGVSLEGREPFLDNKLIEFACALPLRYKLRKGVSKAVLREILYRYVPRELVERPKQGFAVPVEDWFRTDLAKLFDEYVNVDRIRREGLLNAEVVGHWRSDFLAHKTKINTKLWYLFVYEMWAEKWLH
jgi:asparagine synthase (glutamine-hydrolysing)